MWRVKLWNLKQINVLDTQYGHMVSFIPGAKLEINCD